MNAREIVMGRLETFALQHALHEKRDRSFGGRSFGTAFHGRGYSVAVEFPDYDYVVVEVAREEIIGGVPFIVTIPATEFARVFGDKKRPQEHDAGFQMRILESHTSPWFSGEHAIESQMHRRVQRALPSQ